MTDHEKRIREVLAECDEDGDNFALLSTADLRSLLADLDEARGAITDAQERLGAYGMLSGPPQTLAQVAHYLRKWTPSIELKYAGAMNGPDIRHVVKLLEHIAKGASHD